MTIAQIDRVPTAQERQDMQIVGEVTTLEVFNKELSKHVLEYTKAHKPFDERCARLDYKDKIDQLQRESERTHGYIREEDVLHKGKFDFDKYGDMSRFEEIETEEDVEMQNVNNVKTPVTIGYTVKYRCKHRGHYISVFIPAEEWEARKKKPTSK